MFDVFRIRARHRKRRIRKVLEDSGCRTWYEYHMIRDPNLNVDAKNVQEFYHGYILIEVPYSVVMQQPSYEQGFFADGTLEFRTWCKHNCEGKYRVHWHRTRSDGKFDYFDGNGGEAVYVAFENETDAARFALTWI